MSTSRMILSRAILNLLECCWNMDTEHGFSKPIIFNINKGLNFYVPLFTQGLHNITFANYYTKDEIYKVFELF